MRKKILIFLLIVVMAFAGCFLVACKPNTEPVKPEDYMPGGNGWQLPNCTMPSNLPDYMGKIEWLQDADTPEAETTTFNNKKPVVILFSGLSYFDRKENYKLDSTIYTYDSKTTEGGLDVEAQNINLNLAHYWRLMGFNVGVFHYESFADGTASDVNKKVFSRDAMTYKDKNGTIVTAANDLPNFNLTELFVSRWLDLMKEMPLSGSYEPNKLVEVRFVGNSVGANLAVSAADYLGDLYDNGKISGYSLPTRITMTNPYLDNGSLQVDAGEDIYTSTTLGVVEKKVSELAAEGSIFELVENDANHFNSYATPYTGLITKTVGEGEAAKQVTELGNTGDSATYNKLKDNVAYLNFAEKYSASYPERYKALDRASLDWYLYSVFGSDDSSISITTNLGYNNTRPMLDDRNGGGSQSVSRYSLSAWTPTSFTRALRGAELVMKKRTYVNGEYVFSDYTLNKFVAENYQISDLEGTRIVGYVYSADDKSGYINYARQSRMANIELRVIINHGGGEVYQNVWTNNEGFYSITINKQYYDESITIEVVTPNKNYSHPTDIVSDIADYIHMSMNRLYANTNSVTVSLSSAKSLMLVRNCGLVKVQA